jgi:hypothetical protein
MGATIATSSVSAAPAGPSTTPAVAAPTSTPASQGPTSIDSIDTLSTSLVSRPSTKRSHSDMVHESVSTLVSMRSEEPISQMLPPPSKLGSLKRAKTTSGRVQTRSGAGDTLDVKMSKTTTAVAVMGFQTSRMNEYELCYYMLLSLSSKESSDEAHCCKMPW